MKISSIPQIYRHLNRWREILSVLSRYGLANWIGRLGPDFAKDLLKASGGTAIARSLNMWAETFAPNGKLMEASLKKLLFASDVRYLYAGRHGFQPYIDFYEKLLDRIGAPARLRHAVWAGTAKKLFGVR